MDYETLSGLAKSHNTTRLKILLGNLTSETPKPPREEAQATRDFALRGLVCYLERELATATSLLLRVLTMDESNCEQVAEDISGFFSSPSNAKVSGAPGRPLE